MTSSTPTTRDVRLAVSIGCPSGIGPEVSVLAASYVGARTLLVGDYGALRAAAEARGVDPSSLVRVATAEEGFAIAGERLPVLEPVRPLKRNERTPGKPSEAGGAAQLAWVDAACDLVSAGRADALVTGPVSKDAIVKSGAPGSRGFIGHTEHLQERLRAREVVMAFWSDRLTTALVTTHLAIADVPRAITAAGVSKASFWLAALVAALAEARVKVVVSGLNPHAGEAGLFGREEITRIRPGIERARSRLVASGIAADVVGPVPAESAFRLAANGDYDAVVAMYHDQATIPMKLLGFGDAVNVSLGLPIVRTSVDHGTAYDRAGKGTAEARGMIEAMRLAVRLVSADFVARTGGRPRTRAVSGRTRRSQPTRG